MNLNDLQAAVSVLPRHAGISSFGASQADREVLTPLMRGLGATEPCVEDISGLLRLKRGKIIAVRWDLACGDIGFKLPVFSSLLLFHLWKSRRDVSMIRCLTDGGSVSSALAISAIAAKVGLRAEHVISWIFPHDIRAYMLEHAEGNLDLVVAPHVGGPREPEFYRHLLSRMESREMRRSHLCLWHAKYSAVASRWLGCLMAECMTESFDDIVFGLGAGATLGYAAPIRESQGGKPRIIVAEHELSPILGDKPVVLSLNGRSVDPRLENSFRAATDLVPHWILGPHYDVVNEMLGDTQLSEIFGVARYADHDWQDMSHRCMDAGMPVGNSSAANLAIAEHLANQGRTVLTFLYEPLRSFYLRGTRAEMSLADFGALTSTI